MLPCAKSALLYSCDSPQPKFSLPSFESWKNRTSPTTCATWNINASSHPVMTSVMHTSVASLSAEWCERVDG